jgi:hypothetical protein
LALFQKAPRLADKNDQASQINTAILFARIVVALPALHVKVPRLRQLSNAAE